MYVVIFIKVSQYVTSGLTQVSLKMECNSKWNVTQNGKKHLTWYVNKNRISLKMSFKMECQSKLNATQNEMSLKMECAENGISPKGKCQSKLNVTQN